MAERCQVSMHRAGFPSALPLCHSWRWRCDSYMGVFDDRSKIVEGIEKWAEVAAEDR